MTWVVGASSIFGYGALYSDVQVSFVDGKTQDLLQKAYPLANFIAAGFAGSVRIGFMLLQSLADFTRMPEEAPDKLAWDPVWVSTNWSPIARSVFANAPAEEKERGSWILMVGVSPTQSCGLGARVFLTRFCAPLFRPEIMSRATMVCSIGSGAAVAEYKQTIKPLVRFMSGIHKAEIGQPGGWARALGFSISRALADHPHKGVSPHIHTLIVTRGRILVENNDENIYPPDGSVIHVQMPPVAQGYEAFRALARSAGHDAACARC